MSQTGQNDVLQSILLELQDLKKSQGQLQAQVQALSLNNAPLSPTASAPGSGSLGPALVASPPAQSSLEASMLPMRERTASKGGLAFVAPHRRLTRFPCLRR
jgi:hypothetical protein